MQLHYPLNPTTGVEDQTLLPWTNGVPQTGQNGSFPPFAAVVDPMTELVNLIALAGLTPSDGDMDQVTRAVRGGQLDFDATDTGTADAVLCQVGLAHTAIAAGLPFTFVKGPAANTGNAVPTLTITDFVGNNALTGTIVKAGGGAIAKGDLPANALITVRARAPGVFAVVSLLTISDVLALVSGNFVISTAVAIQIGGTAPAASTTVYPNYFATLAAAFTWVSAYTITATGSVTFNLPTGQTVIANAQVGLNHPNANRIFIAGATMKGALPVPNYFAASGNSASARNTDRTANLTGVRSLYGSEVSFPGGGGFVFGNGIGGITNTLITGDTSTGSGLGGDLITVQGGVVGLNGVTIGAAGGRGVLVTQNGSMSAVNSYAFGCLGSGWSIEEGGRFIGSLVIGSFGNGNHNVNASGAGTFFMDQSAGSASVTSRCAAANGVNAVNGNVNVGPAAVVYGCANGIVASDKSFIKSDGALSSANTGYGWYAVDGSTISCLSSSSTANNGTYCYAASVCSSIYLTGSSGNGNSGAATPAVNTVGNANSYITQ